MDSYKDHNQFQHPENKRNYQDHLKEVTKDLEEKKTL